MRLGAIVNPVLQLLPKEMLAIHRLMRLAERAHQGRLVQRAAKLSSPSCILHTRDSALATSTM